MLLLRAQWGRISFLLSMPFVRPSHVVHLAARESGQPSASLTYLVLQKRTGMGSIRSIFAVIVGNRKGLIFRMLVYLYF